MKAMAWYGSWSSSTKLEQGVIIPDFKFPKLEDLPVPDKKAAKGVDYDTFDAIVLTQSCDLAGKEVPYIHVCPIDKLGDYFNEEKPSYYKPKQRKAEFEKLSQNRQVSKFLINYFSSSALRLLKSSLKGKNLSTSFDKYGGDYGVVSFNESRVVATSYLKEFIKQRTYYLKVNPPYRESMAQRYGLYFSRIGNPTDYRAIKDHDYNITTP